MTIWKRFKQVFLERLFFLFAKCYFATLRVREHHLPPEVIESRESGEPLIYAHFHGQELSFIGPYSKRRMAVMTSKSRDGEFMRRALMSFGYSVVKGSSSKGGAIGLINLLHNVKKFKWNASLAVDGPRGPIYIVKEGIIQLARLSERPLIPTVAINSQAHTFKKSWNQAQLPLPFSRVDIYYGSAIYIDRKASKEEVEEKRLELENTLKTLSGINS